MQERKTERPLTTGQTFKAFGVEIYIAGNDMYGVSLRVRPTKRRPKGRLIDVSPPAAVNLEATGEADAPATPLGGW